VKTTVVDWNSLSKNSRLRVTACCSLGDRLLLVRDWIFLCINEDVWSWLLIVEVLIKVIKLLDWLRRRGGRDSERKCGLIDDHVGRDSNTTCDWIPDAPPLGMTVETKEGASN
jgi:hypothetical protein